MRKGNMRVLKLDESIAVADGVRTLSHVMRGFRKEASNPLHKALADLAGLLGKHGGIKWALCGGLAVGAHAKPRGTGDVDVVLEGDSVIDEVANIASPLFRHNRPHALTHRKLGVDVDLVTPEFVKVDPLIVLKAIDTAAPFSLDGIAVPTVTKEG